MRVEFLIGNTLNVSLITINDGDEVITLTQALHSYLLIGDTAQAELIGLDGKTYVDKVDDNREKTQTKPLRISSEVDRVYADTTDELVVNDVSLSRRIPIRSEGSHSVVVWNPWIDKAAAMGDFGDNEYKAMLCVETANAGGDSVVLSPAAEHLIRAVYTLESTL